MLFGKTNKTGANTAQPQPPAQMQSTAAAHSFDTSTNTFEADVMKASMETPILVDFWAPWCGPCKQLMPILEDAVTAAKGKVRLAKVNIDENPELAQALQVKSVPTVFAFYRGQPVTAFQGGQSPAQIKSLIDQLIKMAQQDKPDAVNAAEILPQAAKALADSDLHTAQSLYMAVLSQEEANGEAFAGLVRCFIAAGQLAEARQMIDGADESLQKHAAFAAAKTALELAEESPATDMEAAHAALEKNAEDHAARFELATGLFATGQAESAIDELITIIRKKRDWEEGKAKDQLLKYFEALGPSDPLTIAGRRKLSSVLFS